MKRIKLIFIALGVVMISNCMYSQEVSRDEKGRKEHREKMRAKMEARKIGFLTAELDLTTEEAQKFWPIYNEFSKKMMDLHIDGPFFKGTPKGKRKGCHYEEDFTDEEAEKFLENVFEREQKELDLKKTYYKKMERVLSKKKIAKLLMLERKFRKEVLNKVKRRMKRHRGSEGEKRGRR